MTTSEFPLANDLYGRSLRVTVGDDGTVHLQRVTSGRTPNIDEIGTLGVDQSKNLKGLLDTNIQ